MAMPKQTLGSSITIDALNANPYPIYKKLRREAPVCWVDSVNRWLVTRYEDIVFVDSHPELFTAMERDSLQTRVMGRTMIRMDGEEHARLRKICEEPFRPKVVQQRWANMLQETANEMIDRFVDQGEADLVRDFADPFCARVLRNVLGLLDATDEDMMRWTRDLMDGTSNYADDPQVWERADRSAREIEEAIQLGMKRVKNNPDGSILSSMVHTHFEGRYMTLDEIEANIKVMIGGGLNEPRDGISIVVWGLLTHPEQLAMVLENPKLFPQAVEEAMRWISPLAMYPREVAEDTVLGGVKLAKGERLALVVASANRDEKKWDNPDEFNINREKVKSHLAFGYGAHYCLGAWLARYQLGQAALPILFQRLPNLRLNLDHPPKFWGWVFRGAQHLHVKWG